MCLERATPDLYVPGMPWDPRKHPRDRRGRFTTKTTVGGTVALVLLLGLLAYFSAQALNSPSDTSPPRPSATVALAQLGQDLRADREFVGLTVEDAAGRARIPVDRLVALENGVGPAPTANELRRLARVYALPQDLRKKRMADAGHAPEP